MLAQTLTNPSLDATPAADWPAALTELAQFWPVLALSFGASLLLTPLMRRLALANGIIDLPDARRKAHAKPVAYLGGLAIFLGWFVGIITLIAIMLNDEGNNQTSLPTLFGGDVASIIYIVVGGTAIVLTGLFDDIYGIRARVKVGGQLFAAAAIAQTRVVRSFIESCFAMFDFSMPDPVMQIIGTAMIALLVVGCCNAMNLIDGLDGLSSGVTTIAMAGMLAICLLILARYQGDAAVLASLGIPMLISIATIGAVLGFLPYNFNPASIFMGDTGSLLLGYLCVTTILFMGRIDDNAGLAPMVFAAAVICFALPLTDTALAIVRRKIQGYPIFAPDSMHIHHLFRRCGLSVKQSVFAMYTMGLIFAVIGTTFVALAVRWRLMLGLFLFTVATIIFIGCRVSQRLQATEKANPKPAEGPTGPKPPVKTAEVKPGSAS